MILLNNTLPSYQDSTGLAFLRIAQAKQKVSNALNEFYASVLDAKATSLQSMLNIELDMLNYGETVDKWCWENNVPMLEGIMGWIGTHYSYCIKELDNSIADIVATINGQFYDGETSIGKYSLFEVFEMRNIINNPQSIIDAIGSLKTGVAESVPELDGVVTRFTHDLKIKLPLYTCCLTDKLSEPITMIAELKTLTETCTANLKVNSYPTLNIHDKVSDDLKK